MIVAIHLKYCLNIVLGLRIAKLQYCQKGVVTKLILQATVKFV